jgi:hypothetical protein
VRGVKHTLVTKTLMADESAARKLAAAAIHSAEAVR